MKLLTVVFNIVLVVFTCLVLITDGLSKEVGYILLTLLLLFVPIFNLIIIFSSRANNDWLNFHLKRKAAEGRIKTDDTSIRRPVLKIIAIICNIVLLGFFCYVFVNQYSQHPKESGLILYAVIVFLTPILSLVKFAFYKQ